MSRPQTHPRHLPRRRRPLPLAQPAVRQPSSSASGAKPPSSSAPRAAQLAIIMFLLSLGSIAGSLLAGVLVDRFGPRRVLDGRRDILRARRHLASHSPRTSPSSRPSWVSGRFIGAPVVTSAASFAPFLSHSGFGWSASTRGSKVRRPLRSPWVPPSAPSSCAWRCLLGLRPGCRHVACRRADRGARTLVHEVANTGPSSTRVTRSPNCLTAPRRSPAPTAALLRGRRHTRVPGVRLVRRARTALLPRRGRHRRSRRWAG